MALSDSNPFLRIDPASQVRFGATERFPAAGHQWSRRQVDALILAWAAERPLLVRGEAGSGKSQIARAAAHAIGTGAGDGNVDAPLEVQVIHPRFEALDLLWRMDAVARLADAQPGRELDDSNERYLEKGKMWRAIEQAKADASRRPVLLIDEIDKADAEVPNALLEVLGNRSFQGPPPLRMSVKAQDGQMPLVIVTTNEERELPAPFVRRCVVLNLNPPREPGTFVDWLIKRGRAHTHLKIEAEARREAAQQVYADREACVRAGYPPVGLAEYIDLLNALHALPEREAQSGQRMSQLDWLRRLSVYGLRKHADDDQARAPVSSSAGDGEPATDSPAA